ncbi:MAG TPA: trimeric intracellular cation channel family protein, partial [Chitinophaga sp.]|uniref:trimeric intracellular cation channel family protein n=1 Tax=Chitinophaga sp. TaxID=1869181 RepID=UPI002C114620
MQLTFVHGLELLGTFAFAISGATAAINKSYDVIGLLALAFITAIGGGTVRDLLLGATPVAWMTDELSNTAIIVAAIIASLFFSYVKRLNRWLNIFDAIGLGLFTITGINKGLAAGLPAPICIALGAITGAFGGLMRDVITGEHPVLFTREIYAMASICGGIVYL